MSLVVPAILGGLALAVMALVAVANARRLRTQRQRRDAAAQVRVLIHSINDDRCTGCDACVAVCPTNVLDLVENKSRVLRFQDCIQCEACMWACPTTALVMHPEGTEPPKLRQPDLDQFYQTAIPGQYLIGEVAGKPLVKNAANLGRAVVEHMLATGLRSAGGLGAPGGMVDVAIVGSGPGGLSAALTCIQRGLSYVLFEKDTLVASTVARYPKGKLIMAEPYDCANLSFLPVFDSSKEEMIPLWRDLATRVGLQIRMNEAVETVTRGPDGMFDVRTNVGTARAQRVVLATGLRGKPRTLGVPGENLPKVQSLLEDPDHHRGQTVCVVGGGDSALEAAMALADAGAKVVMSYRGRSFARAQPKNKQAIESYEAQRRIKVKYQSEVAEFAADTVTLKMQDGTQKRYPNQASFILIGADPPIEWLGTLGVHFVERPHMAALPKSDDLVRQFAPRAVPCPDGVAAAVALLQGQAMPEPPANPVVVRSGPRKWLRSASNAFQHAGNKLDRPMPLSEFAKQARRHTGQGRRDKLDARERTRVLRMLRDEGGRQADEDSRAYLIDPAALAAQEATYAEERRRAEGSPPPAAPPRMPPPFPPGSEGPPPEAMPYSARGSAPAGGFSAAGPHGRAPAASSVPSSGGPRPTLLGHPPAPGQRRADSSADSPKPALIVGLARASQKAPIIRRHHDDSVARAMTVAALEPTRQMAGDEARRMLERMEMERREREAAEADEVERRMREANEAQRGREISQVRRLREPPPPREPRLGPGPGAPPAPPHEPPVASLKATFPYGGAAQKAPLHLEDDDTTQAVPTDTTDDPSAAHWREAFDEPTRALDWSPEDLARGSPPGGRVPPGPPPPVPRAPDARAAGSGAIHPAPAAAPRSNGAPARSAEDEETRLGDQRRVISLSEIDWDLD